MKFYPLLVLPVLASVGAVYAQDTASELEYRSAFEGYQAYSEPEIQNWPKMIDQVEQIGGWRVYAREPYEKQAMDKPESLPKAPTHQHDQSGGGAK